MPFINLNETPFDFARNSFDIVIAGAGAAGILLAVEFSKRKKRVLLLECGHFTEDQQRQDLNTVVQTGKVVSNAIWGRKRAIGGTTIAWGGQSLPFSRIDFAKRDWVTHGGWPLSYEDLEPYYHLANRFMRIDESDYEEDIFRLLKLKRAGFNETLIRHHFSKWAPQPNFRIIYNDYLSKHVTLVYNAVLTKLHLGDQGRITSVTVNNFNGKSFSVDTPELILATGGIETNRILLNQDEFFPGGIGNHSGWLGKCFMEHPCVAVGEVRTNRPWMLQAGFNTHIAKRRKYSVRLSLAESCQRQKKLLNGSASLQCTYENDQDPYQEIRKFIKSRRFQSLKVISRDAVKSYAMTAWALLSKGFVYKHKANIRLLMMMEQEPDPGSYISLCDTKDVHGLRQACIHWKITHKTWDTVVHLANTIAQEIERLGLGKVVLYDHINETVSDWESHLNDVCHHMGGTRMSTSPANGVVNTELQVWGHENLYVCSASVFPTSSHSNPTLTLLALAQRLVDKLS